MKKQLIVKKDNALMNAAYTLTLAEQRLILMAVAEAAEDVGKLKHTKIHAHDYANRFNLTKWTAYEALNSASEQLFERRFSYQEKSEKGNISQVKSRWVQSIKYVVNEGLVEIKFADDVLPFLCELKSRFTTYNLEAVSELTSVHAIRLYELLIAWRSTNKTPKISIEDLRLRLGIEPGEYARMTDFKRRVLDAGIKQVNAHSDITANYEQQKTGRKITGFIFYFTLKKQRRDQKAADMLAGNVNIAKRKVISKSTAEAMARAGESYQQLYSRLSSDYIIK